MKVKLKRISETIEEIDVPDYFDHDSEFNQDQRDRLADLLLEQRYSDPQETRAQLFRREVDAAVITQAITKLHEAYKHADEIMSLLGVTIEEVPA